MIAYILSKVTASLIGVMFLFAGGQKFTGLGPMAAELQQHFLKFGPAWGLPGDLMRTAVGGAEMVVAAVLLASVAGFGGLPTMYCAMAGVSIGAGAVATHLLINDVEHLAPAVVVLVLNLTFAVCYASTLGAAKAKQG